MDIEKLQNGSEIRRDYRTGNICIIVPGRSHRPEEVEEEKIQDVDLSKCPFEPRNEYMTTEIMHVGDPWEIRVIENKFPELSGNTPLTYTGGMFKSLGGYGYNEVIIDSPLHTDRFESMPSDHLLKWINTVIERQDILYQRKRIKHVFVFKNYGLRAGASLGHPHTQIMAQPAVLGNIKKEILISKKSMASDDSCIYEKAAKNETGRTLIDTDYFTVIAPFGSRITAESMVMPKRHVNYTPDLTTEEKREMIEILKKVISTNRKIYGSHPYNLVFHDSKYERSMHMHIEIYPRLSVFGGIELGEQIFVNVISPEEYTEAFRKASVSR
ncbi:DUF4921 family protein [Candidatus Parvarchaeota archaeon]|nr:DUF4921 family protein [Candidatus Parvarchaeota archaeon]